MTIADEPRVRRWTREEYYRMGEIGMFQDQRVELIDGEIVEMAPQKDVHSAVIGLAFRAISKAMDDSVWIRMQLPLALPRDSEPEPDISVIEGSPRDYIGTGHPRMAKLVIEVSETTLLYDQRVKSALYAASEFPEYWIINLLAQRVEIHRSPQADPINWRNSSYAEIRHASRGETISPLAAAHAKIKVDDLLP